MLVVLGFTALGGEKVTVPTAAGENKDGDKNGVWISMDYLAGWTSDSENEPLVSRGTGSGLPSQWGALGMPGIQPLFGDDADFGMRHGAQFEVGARLGSDREWGILVGGLFFTENDDDFTATTNGTQLLALTYFNTGPLQGPISTPMDRTERAFDLGWTHGWLGGVGVGGSVNIEQRSSLWGVEGAGLRRLTKGDTWSIDLRFGVRHLHLGEEFNLDARAGFTRLLIPDLNLGFSGIDFDPGVERVHVRDRFETSTDFIGAQIGTQIVCNLDRVKLTFIPRISLGASMHEAEISGSSSILDDNGASLLAYNTGFYTHLNNVGEWDETNFAVMPELDVKMDVRIVKHFFFNAGGYLKYWSSVVRASEQVRRDVDRRGIAILPFSDPTNANSSRFDFEKSDLLNYGFFAGFTLKF